MKSNKILAIWTQALRAPWRDEGRPTAQQSRFFTNFFAMTKANMLVLALPILAMPLLTRLFTPEDFAVLALFSAASAILLSVANFKCDWVLPNAASPSEAIALSVAGVLAILLSASLFAVLAGLQFLDFFGENPISQLDWFVLLLPISVLVVALREMLSGWFVWTSELTLVGKATIAQGISNVSLMIAFGLAGLAAFGLLSALLVASVVGTLSLLCSALPNLKKSFSTFDRESFAATIRRHSKSVASSTVVSLINVASLSLPVLLLASHYSMHEIGWYMLIHRLVGTPMGVLTSALGQSFWAQAADLVRKGEKTRLIVQFRRLTLLLLFACAPLSALCVLGSYLVGPVFGTEEWAGAGDVLVAMIPLFVGKLAFSSLNHLIVFEKKHLQIYGDVLRLALTFTAVWLAQYLETGFIGAIFLISLASLSGHLCLFAAHVHAHRRAI